MQIKRILEKQKNIILGISLLVIGMAFGIGITTYLPLLKGTAKIEPQSSVNTADNAEAKKLALEKFSRELMEAESKHDWEKLYATINPTDKKWLSIEDMTLLYKKNEYSIVSTEVVVHGISVSDDIGHVDKTVIACKTKECTGENKLERRHNDEFVFLNGQWIQQVKKEPSDKARQLAAYIYADYKTREKDRKLLADKYGGGRRRFTEDN